MKKLLILVMALFAVDLSAQVSQEWVRIFNGTPDLTDHGNSIATDAAGNVYVAGGSDSQGTGRDFLIIKYNSAGIQQWAQKYNGPDDGLDVANALVVDSQGNIFVTGSSRGINSLGDYFTIKYNSAGVQQWTQRYNGPGNKADVAFAIVLDDSSNVYITGHSSRGVTLNDIDYATIKYNSNGVEQWVKRYSGIVALNNYARSIAVDDSGFVYVTGTSDGGFATNNTDIATIKYNSSGDQQWVQRYAPANFMPDVGSVVEVDSAGNVYVAGYTFVDSTNYYDYLTIKYNSSGVQQWFQTVDGTQIPAEDKARDMKVDASGNVYVTGESHTGGLGMDFVTVKYNTLGIEQWVAKYHFGNDKATSMYLDNSGNVYVTGSSEFGGNFLWDYATVKYNSSGVQQWSQRYTGIGTGGNSMDIPRDIAVDSQGNVFVTGESMSSNGLLECATIKYSQQVGITPLSSEVPISSSLLQNYPNPFNPMTKIKFDIPKAFNTKLAVYDILGKEVAVLVNDNLKPGSYEVDFSAADLPSGTYFYRLVTDGFSETKKMVVIK